MSNFNDKIKALLAFSASFEGFKSDIEAKLDKLGQPVDLSGLVKKDDLNQSIDSLSGELKKAKFDAFAFDSARRTFGEEIGVLKSFIDKEIAKLNDSVKSSNSSDEIEFLSSALSDLDKQIAKIQSTIVKPKSYDTEIKSIYEKLETAKNIDYSQDIEAVKKSIPKQIDNTQQVESLKLSTGKQIKKLTDALSEQSKQMQELKRLLSLKDGKEKSIKSPIESVSSINKRVESISSDKAVSALKSELATANSKLSKLQTEFESFKSAFEE